MYSVEMCYETSSYFEDLIVIQREVLFSKFVLVEHLYREVKGS